MNGQFRNGHQNYSIFDTSNQNPYSNLLNQFGNGNISDSNLDPRTSEAMIMALFQII